MYFFHILTPTKEFATFYQYNTTSVSSFENFLSIFIKLFNIFNYNNNLFSNKLQFILHIFLQLINTIEK